MSEALLPCPFCGGIPEGPVDATRTLGVWRLVHRGCCTTPNFSVEKPTPEAAIATWNRRTDLHLAAVAEAEARGMRRAAEIVSVMWGHETPGNRESAALFDAKDAILAAIQEVKP